MSLILYSNDTTILRASVKTVLSFCHVIYKYSPQNKGGTFPYPMDDAILTGKFSLNVSTLAEDPQHEAICTMSCLEVTQSQAPGSYPPWLIISYGQTSASVNESLIGLLFSYGVMASLEN